MGAYSKCYLFFEHFDRMLVLDQHAFHERVLYERLKNDKDLALSKAILFSTRITLFSASEISQLETRRHEIEDLASVGPRLIVTPSK